MEHLKLCKSSFIVILFLNFLISVIGYSNEKYVEFKRKYIVYKEKCFENEVLFKDQENKLICDCDLGYIYVASEKRCFPVYERGPCKFNEYLILKDDFTSPICVKNPCHKSGRVKFNGECCDIGKFCTINRNLVGNIGVNETTLKIDCIVSYKSKRSTLRLKRNYCYKGSRRYQQGKCPDQEKMTTPKKEIH